MEQEMEREPRGVDPAALDAIQANALSQLAAVDAGVQALEAHRMRLLASLGHLAVERAGGRGERTAMEVRAVAAEIGALSRVADGTVERQIADAMVLVDGWPLVLEAFATGRIGRGHVRAIVEAGGVLTSSDAPAEARTAYETQMVALAETTTPTRLARAARVAADDGMAHLYAYLPAALAQGIDHRLRRGSRAKPKDDPRTVDQWRADALCELLLTGHGASEPGADDEAGATAGLLAGIRPVVQVTVPVTTIAGASDAPGVLDGAQPVDAETARLLAGVAATWERLLTDPIAGTVVEVDTYAPTAAQRRLLQARDGRCRFPGCGAKARDDDADHTIAWEEGGTTSLGNLAHLCRRHHTLKHATAWTVRQPAPGELRWRSPLGHVYVDRPPPVGPSFAELGRTLRDEALARDPWGSEPVPQDGMPF